MLQMQTTLLRWDERLWVKSRRGQKRRWIQERRLSVRSLFCSGCWQWSVKLSHSRTWLHRIQMQVLLQCGSMVLLGNHSFLWVLSHSSEQRGLCKSKKEEWTAKVPWPSKMSIEDQAPWERGRVSVRMRIVQEPSSKCKEFLIYY